MSYSDEAQLVARAKEDPQAFARLYDQYVDRIYAYAVRQTQDPAQAEDVTAVTFEKALVNLQQFEWRGVSIGAWLYRIARNEIIQQQRRSRVKALFLRAQPTASDGRGPETAVQQRERHSLLHQALHKLAPRDRELITLRFFEDLSSAEVADVLDCSTNTLYVRLHRALQRLRQQLDLSDALHALEVETNER